MAFAEPELSKKHLHVSIEWLESRQHLERIQSITNNLTVDATIVAAK